MPITIEITEQHADRLTGLIRQRDAIQQDGQARIDAIIKEVGEKIDTKNELIQGWIGIHLAGAGHDPDAPRGNSRIMPENGKHILTVEEPPAPAGPRVSSQPGPQEPPVPQAPPADGAQMLPLLPKAA